MSGPTLILTWIPNSTLRKNTRSIENSPNKSHGATPKSSPRRKPRQEFSKSENTTTTPTTCMTDLSPMDSCVSIGSDLGEKFSQNADKEEVAVDSNTDSIGSKDEDLDSLAQMDESANSGSRLDSGRGSVGDDCVQNNEKCIKNLNKLKKVGQNVNDLYVEGVSKINSELNNLTQLALAEDISPCKENSVEGSNNHQNKTDKQRKLRTSSGKSISIEMDGDSLCVTTEELDDEVLSEQNNVDSKQDDECSHDIPLKCSQEQSISSLNSDKDSVSKISEDSVNGDNIEEKTVNGSEESSFKSMQTVPPHPQSLDLSAINTTATSPGLDNGIIAPDISITRQRYSSDSSTTTSGPDSDPPSPYSSSPSSLQLEPVIYLDTPSSPESLSHNLQFPENAVSSNKDKDRKTAKEQICGVFSVDLGKKLSMLILL